MRFLIALLCAVSYAQTEWRYHLPDTDYNKEVFHSLRSVNKTQEGKEKFWNYEFDATNVLDFDVDPVVMRQIRKAYNLNLRGKFNLTDPRKQILVGNGSESFEINWVYFSSDIRWVSPRNLETYERYYEYVRKLGVFELFDHLIDYESRIVVYQIFFVVRSGCYNYNWHTDWETSTNGNAFTVMIPVDKANIGLAFKDRYRQIQSYEYQQDQAIAFANGFAHSTDIGHDNEPKAFFCFSIGTDKQDAWEEISKTGARMSDYFMHPWKGWSTNNHRQGYNTTDEM